MLVAIVVEFEGFFFGFCEFMVTEGGRKRERVASCEKFKRGKCPNENVIIYRICVCGEEGEEFVRLQNASFGFCI